VVILIQENRSFDHYFGSYRGVRGFSDQSAAFQQPDPANTTNSPVGQLLPFHLDTTTTNAACTHDISHDWVPQHQSWDNGAMDGFVTSRLPIDANDAVLAMGYYNRADLPYYYALADAFTICDNFFCSVMGPTDPNRLYTMAASIDPDGTNGGPILQTVVTNRASIYGRLTYTTMPEQLQARGISWKVYSSPDATIAGGILSFRTSKTFRIPHRFCTRTPSGRSSPWIFWPMSRLGTCRKFPGLSARWSRRIIHLRPRSSAKTFFRSSLER
jgi:phospholipase C